MTDERFRDRWSTAATAVFAAAAGCFQLSSYDLWWHLATGRYMSEGHGIPRLDPFSFTAEGARWIDHEWLFQVVVHGGHELAGPTGLVLLRMLLITAVVLLGFSALVRVGRIAPPAAALLMVPLVLAGRDRFLLRPELFTLLFAALLLTRLLARDEPPSLRRDAWLLPLFALWANLHAGLIVGVVLLGAIVAGRVAEGLPVIGGGRALNRAEIASAVALVLAAAAAGLVNPFLHLVYVTPFELTGLIESGLYDNLEWRRPGLDSQWLYYLMVVVVLGVAAAHLRRRPWSSLLPLAFLTLISLRYVRNIGLFCLLAPVLVAAIIAPREDRPRLAGLSRTLAVPVLGLLAAWLVTVGFHFPSGFGIDVNRVPVGGVDYLERHHPAPNLFNVYGFGGYVAWRLWPDVEIFIDGRNEVFREVRAELKAAVDDSRRWRDLLDRHGINTALVSYIDQLERVTLMDPAGGPPTTVWWPYTVTHFPRSEWALVHWDDVCLVYLRRTGANAELISADEIHHVYPADAGYQVEAIRRGQADLAGCIAELEARLAEDPGSWRAHHLYEAVVSAFFEPVAGEPAGGS